MYKKITMLPVNEGIVDLKNEYGMLLVSCDCCGKKIGIVDETGKRELLSPGIFVMENGRFIKKDVHLCRSCRTLIGPGLYPPENGDGPHGGDGPPDKGPPQKDPSESFTEVLLRILDE